MDRERSGGEGEAVQRSGETRVLVQQPTGRYEYNAYASERVLDGMQRVPTDRCPDRTTTCASDAWRKNS